MLPLFTQGMGLGGPLTAPATQLHAFNQQQQADGLTWVPQQQSYNQLGVGAPAGGAELRYWHAPAAGDAANTAAALPAGGKRAGGGGAARAHAAPQKKAKASKSVPAPKTATVERSAAGEVTSAAGAAKAGGEAAAEGEAHARPPLAAAVAAAAAAAAEGEAPSPSLQQRVAALEAELKKKDKQLVTAKTLSVERRAAYERAEAASAKAAAREDEARRSAEAATRARDKALAEVRALKDDLAQARDAAAASRADARDAHESTAAARAELAHVKATLEVCHGCWRRQPLADVLSHRARASQAQLNEARDVARALNARLMQAEAAPQQQGWSGTAAYAPPGAGYAPGPGAPAFSGSLFSVSPGATVGAPGAAPRGYDAGGGVPPMYAAPGGGSAYPAGLKRSFDAVAAPPQQGGGGWVPQQLAMQAPQGQAMPQWGDWAQADAMAKRMRGGV